MILVCVHIGREICVLFSKPGSSEEVLLSHASFAFLPSFSLTLLTLADGLFGIYLYISTINCLTFQHWYLILS